MAGDNAGRLGGWLVVTGALGVAVITAIYASAPTAASAPLPAGVPIADAIAATQAAAGQLRMAGTIGIVADVLLIGGCLVLALRPGEAAARQLFWVWLALSTAIFLVVDGLASGILPAIAASGEIGAFGLGRGAYDLAFTLGVGTFGAGFVVAGRGWNGVWRWSSLLLGILSVGSFALHLTGVTVPLLLGICVGAAGLLAAAMGYRETRTA